MDGAVQKELCLLAQKMLHDECDLIEGCRKICSLCFVLDWQEIDVLIPFFSIDSETDHFLIGDVRNHADLDYLKRLDLEKNEYLHDEKEFIFTSCRNLISWCQNEEYLGP